MPPRPAAGALKRCGTVVPIPLQRDFSGGETGIRTPDTLLAHTRFPIVLLRPARTSLRFNRTRSSERSSYVVYNSRAPLTSSTHERLRASRTPTRRRRKRLQQERERTGFRQQPYAASCVASSPPSDPPSAASSVGPSAASAPASAEASEPAPSAEPSEPSSAAASVPSSVWYCDRSTS